MQTDSGERPTSTRHPRATALFVILSLAVAPGFAQWTQWGGPNRNFMSDAKGLASQWPEAGPRKIWQRTLGEGYSSVIVDEGRLYTMYRKAPTDLNEYTVALDAATGETIWEHENPSPATTGMMDYGPGPHSTPLICAERLFSIGSNAVLHCFDKKSGKVLWRVDFPEEFGAPVPYYGYASSPIAYENLIILPVDRWREDGGPWATARDDPRAAKATQAQSLAAFDQATGRVVWKGFDYPTDYSSPILIHYHGRDQLVVLMRREIIGVAPESGALLWHMTVEPVPDENIPTPIWTGDGLLFCTASYNSGSRVIRLNEENGKTVPEQLWYNRKLRVLQGNAIRVGDYVYGTSGGFGAILMTCLDVRTGERQWVQRGFGRSTMVFADGKLIMLDEDGQLLLAAATPKGVEVHSRCQITERLSWTPPTLVGTTLYVRDRKNILALDLGD